jgi:predicted Zn-dependent protease
MSELVETARRQLWEAADLSSRDVERLLTRLCGRSIDRGELFFQALRSEAWVIEDGIVKEGAFSADRGVGVRAVSGERSGFAYCEASRTTQAVARIAPGTRPRSRRVMPPSIRSTVSIRRPRSSS